MLSIDWYYENYNATPLATKKVVGVNLFMNIGYNRMHPEIHNLGENKTFI